MGTGFAPPIPLRALGLEPSNPAGNQQEPITDNPTPCRNGVAESDQAKVRGEGNEKEDERNNPYRHRWSFT